MRTNRSELIAHRGLQQGASITVRAIKAKPAPVGAWAGINWSLCVRLGLLGAAVVILAGVL